MFDRTRKGENALLIQPHGGAANAAHASDEEQLEEFTELARSAGASVVGTVPARVLKPNPSMFLGSGKVDEVLAACEATGADLVLVNHALSPVQERNLEKALSRRVIDRTGLILDIFAQRARSHEGKLQVELAQLKHLASRLVRGWSHLDSQRGGSIGLRGPGETQLETDRRLLSKRVDMLSRRLEKVEVQQTQMRRARLRNELPRVALVGYTNAGKSTLFNALTDAGVYVADQLFATLDPTVRRIEGLPCGPLVLADTVGFVRDLPHELVAAFRSTLSEAREADLLLHVIDVADPLREERIAQVNSVLEDIGAGELPQLRVYNKIDRIEDAIARRDVPTDGVDRLWLSARTGAGVDLLQAALSERFAASRARGDIVLPSSAGRLRARLHALNAVTGESSDEHGWTLRVDLPTTALQQLTAEFNGVAGVDMLHPLLAGSHAPTYNR